MWRATVIETSYSFIIYTYICIHYMLLLLSFIIFHSVNIGRAPTLFLSLPLCLFPSWNEINIILIITNERNDNRNAQTVQNPTYLQIMWKELKEQTAKMYPYYSTYTEIMCIVIILSKKQFSLYIYNQGWINMNESLLASPLSKVHGIISKYMHAWTS